MNRNWLLIILIFLMGFFIRSHNIGLQEVFVDEAYHITRGAVVWDFEQHPAQFSHGKLLLYFWLGIFEADPLISLPVGRLAVGLFSLLNIALVMLIGQELFDQRAGLFAGFLYAIFPFAFFFERITLADSFAATFAALIAWRSLVFMRRPSLRESVMLGVLVALTLMAKLTMALVPFLPALATLMYQERLNIPAWLRRYFLPLCVAAVVSVVLWLPILVPAALAEQNENSESFVIINAENMEQLEASAPLDKVLGILPMIRAYTSSLGLLTFAVALMYSAITPDIRREGILLLIWMLLMILPSAIAANGLRTRYFVPLALPFVLLIALAFMHVWLKRQAVFRIALTFMLFLWGGLFVAPFTYQALTGPDELPLGDEDWVRYMSGNFSGDALRSAAEVVNRHSDFASRTYSTWGTCQLLYFYVTEPVECLPPSNQNWGDAFLESLGTWMSEQEYAFIVLNGDEPFGGDELRWQIFAQFQRPHIDRPVTVWRVSWAYASSRGI